MYVGKIRILCNSCVQQNKRSEVVGIINTSLHCLPGQKALKNRRSAHSRLEWPPADPNFLSSEPSKKKLKKLLIANKRHFKTLCPPYWKTFTASCLNVNIKKYFLVQKTLQIYIHYPCKSNKMWRRWKNQI